MKKSAKKSALPEKRLPSPVVNIIDTDGDVVASATSLRDVAQLLLLPIFNQSKNPDMNIYRWRSPDSKKAFTVIPSATGRATVWDADVIIYLATTIYEMIKNGDFDPSVEAINGISIPEYDLMRFKSMSGGGDNYNDLKASLNRLAGTQLNIETDQATEGVSLIQRYYIERNANGRAQRLVICPSYWLYDLIVNPRNMLDISPDYLKLSRPFKRQLYRICRCFCGDKETFIISLYKLWTWCGQCGPLKKFRYNIKECTNILDYSICYLPVSDSVQIINNKIFEAKRKKYKRDKAIDRQQQKNVS